MYDSELFSKARLFIYRNARALDLARWRFHFESADKSEVLTALSAYQNKDGGFGWGLEADAWNPNSSPMQTCTATEILDETAFSDTQHPIIQGILAYLESGSSFDGSFWYKAIPSTNDHPHAPWWACTDNFTGNGDYNPTAALAGFLFRHAKGNAQREQLAIRIVKEAYDQLLGGGRENGFHTIICYLRMHDYLSQTARKSPIDLQELASALVVAVDSLVEQDSDAWNNSYSCKPSHFHRASQRLFTPLLQDLGHKECTQIKQTQCADGSWAPTWAWADYPEQWAVAKLWWKSDLIIRNLLFLRSMHAL